MTHKSEIENLLKKQLSASKKHLEYSYEKVKKINLKQVLDEENLETLESFASRFARYSDIVIAKYFRFMALKKDPAWRGSVVDLMNFAEKWGWISSAQVWIRIRELRNLAAHEYNLEDYRELYKELISLTDELLSVSESIV